MSSEVLELARLSAPWPEWVFPSSLGSRASVVAIGSPLFSSEISAFLPVQLLTLLTGGLSGDGGVIDGWFYAEEAYRRLLLRRLPGMGAVRGLFVHARSGMRVLDSGRFTPDPPPESIAQSGPAMISVRFSKAQLCKVGLPPQYMPLHPENVLGINPLGDRVLQGPLPEPGVVLQTYEYASFMGGDHFGDCLVASATVPRATLACAIAATFRQAGVAVDDLGVVAGPRYEELCARGT